MSKANEWSEKYHNILTQAEIVGMHDIIDMVAVSTDISDKV